MTIIPIAIHVGASSSWVTAGVDGGEAGGASESGGVDAGAGLVAEAQPTTRRPSTVVVVKRESEGRISMSSGTVCHL
jgi:hypothetical protein